MVLHLHEPVGQSYHCHQESDCKASSGITWQECPKRQGILSCYGKGKVQRFLAITNNTIQKYYHHCIVSTQSLFTLDQKSCIATHSWAWFCRFFRYFDELEKNHKLMGISELESMLKFTMTWHELKVMVSTGRRFHLVEGRIHYYTSFCIFIPLF